MLMQGIFNRRYGGKLSTTKFMKRGNDLVFSIDSAVYVPVCVRLCMYINTTVFVKRFAHGCGRSCTYINASVGV